MMAELLFEHYDIPKLAIEHPAALALYGNGLTSGTVLHCGGGLTYAMSMIGGKSVQGGPCKQFIGGQDLTNVIEASLDSATFNDLAGGSRSRIAKSAKETPGFVYNLSWPPHTYPELATASEEEGVGYELPDGTTLKIEEGFQRWRVPEMLFDPTFAALRTILSNQKKDGNLQLSKKTHRMLDWLHTHSHKAAVQELKGVPLLVSSAISNVPVDSRKDMYASIVLSGGSTHFNGFVPRLHTELESMCYGHEVKIVNGLMKDRALCRYIGGTVMASHAFDFEALFLSKDTYDEKGGSALAELRYSSPDFSCWESQPELCYVPTTEEKGYHADDECTSQEPSVSSPEKPPLEQKNTTAPPSISSTSATTDVETSAALGSETGETAAQSSLGDAVDGGSNIGSTTTCTATPVDVVTHVALDSGTGETKVLKLRRNEDGSVEVTEMAKLDSLKGMFVGSAAVDAAAVADLVRSFLHLPSVLPSCVPSFLPCSVRLLPSLVPFLTSSRCFLTSFLPSVP
jgi:hypothetical protein